MRFKNFINEDSGITVQDIARDCQPWIKYAQGGLVYRGMKHDFDGIAKVMVRKDRRPKDTPAEVSEVIDEIFQHMFGWKPRSQAVFCVKDWAETEYYGYPYVIFPIGEFKLVASPHIHDLTTELTSEVGIDSTKFGRWWPKASGTERAYIMNYVDKIVTKDNYRSDLPLKVIDLGAEIMIGCDAYYAIRQSQLRLFLNDLRTYGVMK